MYTAVKVYITFLKGLYAHPEHWGVNYAHPDHRGVSNTHTQSAVWGVNYAHPDHRASQYAHPKRSLGRHK
jgi:hypothetical protein